MREIPDATDRSLLYIKGTKYKSADSETRAIQLVEQFVARAKASPYLVYKEPFLGTPHLFRYLLTLVDNSRLRNIRPATTERYRVIRQKGYWRGGGDDYLLGDPFGTLIVISGQHRSASHADFDDPIEIWLAYTKDPNAYAGVDQNRPRNHQDADKFLNAKQRGHSILAAIVWEWMDFPMQSRASPTERAVITNNYQYQELADLISDPIGSGCKGSAGHLAPMLRCLRLDQPGQTPWAYIWFRQAIRKLQTIGDLRVHSLEVCTAYWGRVPRITIGDVKTRALSWIAFRCFRDFYEGNPQTHFRFPRVPPRTGQILDESGKWQLPSDVEWSITNDYIDEEIRTGWKKCRIKLPVPPKDKW